MSGVITLYDHVGLGKALFHVALTDGDVVSRLSQSVAVYLPESIESGFWSMDHSGISFEHVQDEYTRLFDVGLTGKPPCPLSGSSYAGAAKMKSMEEALRFYNHFGLVLNQEQRAMPDQLGTELEFLHFLSYRQAELIEANEPDEAAI